MTNPTVFHCLSFRDSDAGIAFVTALGFRERLVVRNEADPSRVEHAQFHWGECGAIMFGSASRVNEGDNDWQRPIGVASCFLVVGTDAEVDAAYERGLAAGGTSISPPKDEDYGGRNAAVRDPEGNQWSIGSYAGE